MIINSGKTNVMLFHKANDHRSKGLLGNVIRLNNEDIKVVDKFKYLGVYIDSTLSYMSHYDHVKLKITIALDKMYSFRRFFSTNVVKTFFSCYVISNADYCISLWSVQTDIYLDKLQNK